jgi:hypothetical protein
MLQWIYMYVASVCFKCFIYFFRRTLQACLFGCCICFTHRLQVFIYILHMFCSSFSSVFWIFFSSVLDACFKYFICLHTYVVNVLYECFNSKSGVAHVAMAPVAGGQRLAARLRLLPRAFLGRCASPSPPFPSLPFPLSHRDSSSSRGKQRGVDGPACGRAAWTGRVVQAAQNPTGRGAWHKARVGNRE